MARFFTVQSIKDKLLLYGIYTALTMPPDAWIDEVAVSIEDRMENWLGFDLGVNTYSETYTVDALGRIQLRKYPVISIEKIQQLLPLITDSTGGPVLIPSSQYNVVGITNQRSIVWVGQHESTVQVDYTAGSSDPRPEFLGVMFATFMELLKHVVPPGYPDWGFMSEPTRDYTSLSLPSGLSKSFELGKPSGGGSGGVPGKGTIEDRLFAPLDRYRRLYKV
jgi:hypothetical protein